jgi:uncharacterized repeat protein (TIGR01451 family)
VVGYTIVITNTGQTDYLAATIADSLSGLLPDSVYNADAAVIGGGLLNYTAPNLTWTGALLIGASATITYSITVHDPDIGDKFMTNAVTSTSPGSTCPVGGTLPACSAAVRVLIPALVITKTADTATVIAGNDVHYTVTVTNTGQTDYAPATFTDPLTDVLDDATYAGGATATIGSVAYTNSTLVWTGALTVGQSATISYFVTASYPLRGDKTLINTVRSAVQGSTCQAGNSASACTATVAVLVPTLTIVSTTDVNTVVVAGGRVNYTIMATNTGQGAYPAVTISDPLAALLDDAAYRNDASATSGTVTVTGGTLTWTGPLAIGQNVIITFSIDVDNPDAGGDAQLATVVTSSAVGSNCTSGSADARCSTSLTVDAQSITLSDLPGGFTLAGQPNVTVTGDGLVAMTVTTNSPGGYQVSLQAAASALDPSAGDGPSIPIGYLQVRETGTTEFTPISGDAPVITHTQDAPSAPGGDAVSNDFRINIPFVPSGTYSVTLNYVAAAR